jgi:hypothetical protein
MRALRIAVSDAPTPEVVHRFRNFGEDIYRALRDQCSVSIDEIDAAKTSFLIRDVHKRNVRRISKIIHDELRRHNFEASATVTEV